MEDERWIFERKHQQDWDIQDYALEYRILESHISRQASALKGIEFYVTNGGMDANIIKSLARSAAPFEYGSSSVQFITEEECCNFPFSKADVEIITEVKEESPFYTFTFILKQNGRKDGGYVLGGGERKLLFATKSEADDLHTDSMAWMAEEESDQPISG